MTNLNVPGFGLYDITVTYDSFTNLYGDTPTGLPITFGNTALATALAQSLASEMNADATPLPTVPVSHVLFIHSILNPTTVNGSSAAYISSVFTEWTPGGTGTLRTVVQGYATVTAVPEASSFLFVGLVGLGLFGWKRLS